MAEEKKARVEEGMKKMINDIDRMILRKMEAQMYHCSEGCCKNLELSVDKKNECVERCSVPLVSAQNHVRKELEYFQNRLQRCIVQCHDDINDKIPANPTDDEVKKYTNIFESCASDCCDKHLKLLPSLTEKLIGTIKLSK